MQRRTIAALRKTTSIQCASIALQKSICAFRHEQGRCSLKYLRNTTNNSLLGVSRSVRHASYLESLEENGYWPGTPAGEYFDAFPVLDHNGILGRAHENNSRHRNFSGFGGARGWGAGVTEFQYESHPASGAKQHSSASATKAARIPLTRALAQTFTTTSRWAT